MKRRILNNYKPQVAQDNTFLQKYIYDKKLSINDLKLFKAILSKVKYNDSLFQDSYEINYGTLDIVGVPKSNRYREVEKSLEKLMTTFVTIRAEDRERLESSEKTNDQVLKKAKGNRKLGLIKNDWIYDKKSSKIIVSIPEVLKPFFLELADKEYTIYCLENLSDFSNIIELKLYELFARWKNRGYFNVTLENLREYLEIPNDKYERYTNFKNFILLKSINKIMKTTNLAVDFRELKKNGEILKTNKGPGNKVYSLEFIIVDKEKFDKEKYITKIFKNTDNVEYIILEINEDKDGKLSLKLFDKKTSSITELTRPISKEELIKYCL